MSNYDDPIEEDADSWYQGYTAGREEITQAVVMALGPYAPPEFQQDDDATVILAVTELAARMVGLEKK